MQCSNCNAQIQSGSRFCSKCGAQLPLPDKSGAIGDVGMIKGDIHIGTSGHSTSPSGDYCPVCGMWAKIEESFRCKDCGRTNLHKEHRDAQLGVCSDCAPKIQPETPSPDPAEKNAERLQVKGDEMTLALATGVELTLVRVSAGVFQMGEDDQQHKVHLDEYWIGKTPVTNAQYKAFVEEASHAVPYHWESDEPPKGKEYHPIVEVSWHDARAFCTWASQVGGAVVRLPTEAEWEKAARGTDGCKYPWGNQDADPSLCNFDNNIGDTTRVHRYSPAGNSPYGCADMAGNVNEWTSSLYKDYPYRVGDGRENPDAGDDKERVLRGGAFFEKYYAIKCADRSPFIPTGGHHFFGFRVCAPSSLLSEAEHPRKGHSSDL